MTSVELGMPRPGLTTRDADFEEALRGRVDGQVRFDAGARSAYSTDSSNYRQGPVGVVVPRTVAAAVAAVVVSREHGAPVLSRGGGTSLAGQSTNAGVVLDWTKYCHRLNRQLAPHEFMSGPRPSTHRCCTIGGMVGSNSCGATAQAYGETVDNVRRLEVLTYDGQRMWVGRTPDEEYAAIHAAGGRRNEEAP
jgi:FAD/FMN-containing dehydrogenase